MALSANPAADAAATYDVAAVRPSFSLVHTLQGRQHNATHGRPTAARATTRATARQGARGAASAPAASGALTS